MVISVATALELDQSQTCNWFALVEENDTSDGSFVVSTVLERELKRGHKIVVVLFHNTIGHYHAIGQKIGYNLLKQQELGNVVVFDFLKTLSDKVVNPTDESILKNLYVDLKEKITAISESNNVTLFMENIGNLLLLGFQLNAAILFIQCCRMLTYKLQKFSILCLIHNILGSEDLSLFTNYLLHMSDLNIILNDLETGKANDVSGKFTVCWRTKDLMQWNEPSEYHYQLLDRNVIVFAPGTKHFL